MTQNILFIIDGLPGGGAERVVLTLAEGMLQKGHKVTLISLRDVCDYSIPSGLEYCVLSDHTTGPFRKIFELRRRAKALDQTIIQLQAKQGVFHRIFSNLPKTDQIVTHCKSIQPKQLWFCIHNMFSVSYLAKKQGIARYWKRKKIRKIYQNQQIIAVSQAVLKDLCSAFAVIPQATAVIYNPFDIAAIKQQAMHPCTLAGQEFFIHVGRLHPQKRHDRLLEAYALSQLNTPLVMIGNGSKQDIAQLHQQVEQLHISDQVQYLGFQSNPYSYIREAKALLLSSDYEGFGNVLVEALACGTQVVSTPCPGGPEEILIGDLRRGLSTDMSAASLAQAIKEIDAHPVDLSTVDLSKFSLNVICEQYLTC